jgi:hypothetical protein
MARTTLSKEAVAEILRRFGVAHADEALIARASELHVAGAEQLARLPRDFDKGVEPAHVFSVPLR